MGNYDKLEGRREDVHRLLGKESKLARFSRCAVCGEAAVFELNRGHGPIEFFCAAHLPRDSLR